MTDVTVTTADGVAVLTLNRPDRRNAYTASMGGQLSRAYRRCDDDDEVRAIVLTGAGEAFCAGADFDAPTDTRSTQLRMTPTSPRHRSSPPPSSCGHR